MFSTNLTLMSIQFLYEVWWMSSHLRIYKAVFSWLWFAFTLQTANQLIKHWYFSFPNSSFSMVHLFRYMQSRLEWDVSTSSGCFHTIERSIFVWSLNHLSSHWTWSFYHLIIWYFWFGFFIYNFNFNLSWVSKISLLCNSSFTQWRQWSHWFQLAVVPQTLRLFILCLLY